jgi:hypothetical protein
VDAHAQIERLERFADALSAVVGRMSPQDARWRPDDGSWSILEVVMHLADEEVEDFRRRVELTLRDPAADWPPIDPPRWAVERRYNDGDLAEALQRFATARRESVRWLRGLKNPDWSRTHEHPKLGAMRAGDVFTSWVAHDALHLKQIAKRLYQMAARDGGEYGTAYAGPWTA